jgi:serine/threonine protein kinase
LSKRSGRHTYLAQDLLTSEQVVIKLLLFGPDFDWADLKLFEREAQILQTLSHPAIPEYRDHFEISLEGGRGLALVQTYIDAPSLQEWMEQGRRFAEPEVRDLAQKLLRILVYLHELHPPVIHRDLKPSNILLGSDQQVYLVDFGSVQAAAPREQGSYTVVGSMTLVNNKLNYTENNV